MYAVYDFASFDRAGSVASATLLRKPRRTKEKRTNQTHKQKRPLFSGRLLLAETAGMLVARARFELATFGL
jgi:hypothetical protein